MYEWYRARGSGRVVVVLALCLFCSGRAFCQHVSAGIIGGGALTSDFVPLDVPFTPYREYSTSKDYVVGAMLAVSIPANFSLEADALYRPMNFTGTAAFKVPSEISRVRRIPQPW